MALASAGSCAPQRLTVHLDHRIEGLCNPGGRVWILMQLLEDGSVDDY